MHWYVRGLSCKPNIYVSWSTSEQKVRLVHRLTGLSPPVNIFTNRSKAVLFLWINYVIFCLVLLCFHARLFVDFLWSPAGKGLTFWFSFAMSNCDVSPSNWYPGSGAVLDCIDSWSVPSFLLWLFYGVISTNFTRTGSYMYRPSSRQNLSSGILKNRDSDRSSELQRLARILKFCLKQVKIC